VRFMVFLCVGSDPLLDPEERRRIPEAVGDWIREMEGRGVRMLGHQLADPGDAATVRVRNGEIGVSDGPYAVTDERIVGFNLLECRDIAEAIEVAARHPVARFGSLEVRPVVDD
jgi:hypothetical protein